MLFRLELAEVVLGYHTGCIAVAHHKQVVAVLEVGYNLVAAALAVDASAAAAVVAVVAAVQLAQQACSNLVKMMALVQQVLAAY